MTRFAPRPRRVRTPRPPRAVLIGFLTGVGVQVSLLEVSGLLGLHSTGNHPLTEIVHDVRSIAETNPYAVAVSLAVLVIIVGGRKISQKIPGGLIAVLAAIAASWALNLGAHLETLGAHRLGAPIAAYGVEWQTMTDPEGHEFCVVAHGRLDPHTPEGDA